MLEEIHVSRTDEIQQQGSQTRWKHALVCEISARPSTTISNSRFNQSALSSEQQRLLPESCKRPGLPGYSKKYLKRHNLEVPYPLHRAGQVIALIKVKAKPRADTAEC